MEVVKLREENKKLKEENKKLKQVLDEYSKENLKLFDMVNGLDYYYAPQGDKTHFKVKTDASIPEGKIRFVNKEGRVVSRIVNIGAEDKE